MAFSIRAAFIALTLHAAPDHSDVNRGVPVIVELFTSEGCSSCPSADALLAQLIRNQPVSGARVIALGEHVDYWDDLGWKDSFSAKTFTERQLDYVRQFKLRGPYTPQMVIGGLVQVLGSDEQAAREAIARIANSPAGTMTLRLVELGTDVSLDVQASWSGGRAEILLAVVEDHAVTKVTRGENAGRAIEHAAIVRSLTRLGTGVGVFSGRVTIDARLAPQPAHVVVFAQEPHGGRIYAAETVSLKSTEAR